MLRSSKAFRLGIMSASTAVALACEPPRPLVRAPEHSPGLHQAAVRVDTLERSYSVYLPPGLPAAPAAVLAFHGGSGGSGERLRGFIGAELNRLAGELGFLAVYPDGIGGTWNGCRAGATTPANLQEIDDLAFLRALIARLEEDHGVDRERVFALGFSNGAHLAFRAALEAPGVLRAIAGFGANLPAEGRLDCREEGVGLAVMLVTGTEDRINPFEGGDVALPDGTRLGRVRSAGESLRYFGRLAGHNAEPSRDTVLAREPDAELWVERARLTVPQRPEVVLYTVHGGGHTIPSPTAAFPEFLGATERRFDAVAEAVRFFERHGLSGTD